MKKETYYCDICNKEVNNSNLTKKTIPVINKIYATGGRGNIKLAYMGEVLEFEEQELCPECILIHDQIFAKISTIFAQEWLVQVDKIKNTIKN